MYVHDQVKILSNASSQEFQDAIDNFKPSIVYLSASASFEKDNQSGCLQAFSFSDGSSADKILPTFFSGKGVKTLYLDASADFEKVKELQSQGEVDNVIAWPSTAPATIASQFAHTFFSVILTYASTPNEAYTMASHVVQAHCTNLEDNTYKPPALPMFVSALKAALPDNSSIPTLDIIGLDTTKSLASAVPGWSDLRLLAPRAELRLLLCGGSSLIDSHRLSFLGEALRALLVMETRTITLVNTSSCSKTPVNLAAGCSAIRCEVMTASGRSAVVVLGGQPDVLKDNKLVEHALRVTLVTDSLSLQFRLPPPGVSVPAPRSSAAIAGSTPVVDTLVLSSIWAVQVLRSLCQDPNSFGLISLGIAAVGASATSGIQAGDAQRLKMLVSGMGPTEHQAVPLPETTALERAAVEAAGPGPSLDTDFPLEAPPHLSEISEPPSGLVKDKAVDEQAEAEMVPEGEGGGEDDDEGGEAMDAEGVPEEEEGEEPMAMEQ